MTLSHLRMLSPALLLLAAGSLAGCAANSARPGTVCGHCDHRFSYVTPNPCDNCVPEVHLPGYGHTPTTWHLWPEELAHSHIEYAPPGVPFEAVPPPDAAPPSVPAQMPADALAPPRVDDGAMHMPGYQRPMSIMR